jgi:hypothetical protein
MREKLNRALKGITETSWEVPSGLSQVEQMSVKVRIALLALIGAVALSVAAAFLIPQLRPSGEHKAAYQWSPNLAVAPPEAGKQRAETTLATDADERVWLSYLDADYSHGSGAFSEFWSAWPRRLTIVSSDDQGKTFGHPYVLAPMGENASFTTDANGNLYASWIQASYDDHQHRDTRIEAARLDGQSPVQISTELQCPVWSWPVEHYAANMTVSSDGTIHIVGVDTYHAMLPSDQLVQRLLYARSTDGLNSCTNQIRLPLVGGQPQLVSTRDALLIVGAVGFYVSVDNGETFGPRQLYDFGYRFARAAGDPSRRIVYVVGDAKRGGGLWLSASRDGGKSWKRTRIDDARSAKAWRFPAITVSKDGRVHVVWMDDREGYGALYHAYSDDSGRSFSKSERVSDQPFPFPPPPPVLQPGTWIGDYISVTTVADKVVVAWSDQRAGRPLSAVYSAVGSPETSP